MTTISLTSGQVMDIMSLLEEKENVLYDAGDKHLAAYYMNLGVQFQRICDRMNELPGEQRVANLVMTM